MDIATICGTSGPLIVGGENGRKRDLSQEEEEEEVHRPMVDSGDRRLQGVLNVQTVSINANMYLFAGIL